MSGERRALVTGGSAGLGQAFCEALSREGWRVTSLDRHHPDGRANVEHIACDLADRGNVDLILPALAADGAWDLVVFNAGISASGAFETIPFEAQRRVIAVNAESPIVLCAGLAHAGALKPGGSIVFISSLSHHIGYPGAASYAASKGAITAYASSIRAPFRRDLRVTVSCAFPGPLRSDHAAMHGPAGALVKRRMEPGDAARRILAAAARGQSVILPGVSVKLLAAAGRLLPEPAARTMRRVIYDRQDPDVW